MPQYKDMTPQEFLQYAEKSSHELGSLGGGWVIDYETGRKYQMDSEDTAIFVSSAPFMIKELVDRLSGAGYDYYTGFNNMMNDITDLILVVSDQVGPASNDHWIVKALEAIQAGEYKRTFDNK